MKKKRLAYIDYWSHKHTRSGDFLRELLSEKFEITDFWWKEKEKIPFNEINEYEYIFFFHVFFPYQIMKKFKNKKIMWAPMYDALNFKNSFFEAIFWKQMSSLGIKILKFSNKISKSIGKEKIESLNLNYFLKPEFGSQTDEYSKLNIFFWDRGRIKIDEWLKLFNKNEINKIVYFPKPDPGEHINNEQYIKIKDEYNFELIEKKFMPKNEFINLMKKCNVFIAPRKKEGIGIAMVEAISRGIYVVGYNDSTMNEYIKDNKIGFIFDENTRDKLNSEYIIKNYEYRKKNSEKSYNIWKIEKEKIISLLEKENMKINKISFYPLFLLDDIKFLLKKIFNINFFYYLK
tara:strand:- start:2196 stop:3233 length:1038 start_codon:yes stop_codon:yes gene_type:complete